MTDTDIACAANVGRSSGQLRVRLAMKRPYDFEFGKNAVSVLGNISQAYMWPRILAVENSIVEEIIRLTGSLSRKQLPCDDTPRTLNLRVHHDPARKITNARRD